MSEPQSVERPSAVEIDERFARLQEQLVPQWELIGSFNDRPQTMVVVPSISVDLDIPPSVLQAYEERYLFLLFLLRKPRARIIYVTSQPIDEDIVAYYLGLLPGVIPSHARKRLILVSPHDGSAAPLTRKLLERPRFLQRLKEAIGDPQIAHLIPFATTRDEKELAVRLGIPMYGSDPRFEPLGTKSGCRRLFEEEGIPHPLGREGVRSVSDLVGAIAEMRRERSSMGACLVKLDAGVSGEGNAVVDLSGLPEAGSAAEAAAIEARVRDLSPQGGGLTTESYLEKLGKTGGVVEERLAGEELRSPSVQLRVTPLGEVQRLSTHDQLLGGKSGQNYLGCIFPADRAYAPEITRLATRLGERLAREGVIGRFAIDFVVVRSAGGEWRPYAIELNLRKGGTTHPFLTLEFLTGGHYDPETARFTAPSGREKHYVASDHLESSLFRTLAPEDLFDFVVLHRLHYDHATQTGVVLHMMSGLSEHGRIGLTAVGDSAAEAQQLYDRAMSGLEEEARRALSAEAD